jgi:hypothetical protein
MGKWRADWHPVQAKDNEGGPVRQSSIFRSSVTADGGPTGWMSGMHQFWSPIHRSSIQRDVVHGSTPDFPLATIGSRLSLIDCDVALVVDYLLGPPQTADRA